MDKKKSLSSKESRIKLIQLLGIAGVIPGPCKFNKPLDPADSASLSDEEALWLIESGKSTALKVKDLNPQLTSNNAFMSRVAKTCPYEAIESSSNELRDNEDFVRLCINGQSKSYRFASPRLMSDLEIICLAVKDNPLNMVYAPSTVKTQLCNRLNGYEDSNPNAPANAQPNAWSNHEMCQMASQILMEQKIATTKNNLDIALTQHGLPNPINQKKSPKI